MKTISVINLNVGSKVFYVKREVLMKSAYFKNLLSDDTKERIAFLEKKSEQIFIDRNGDIFRHILQFLRTGRIFVKDSNILGRLKNEAEYYGLNGLFKNIEDTEAEIEDNKDEYMFLDSDAVLELCMESFDISDTNEDEEIRKSFQVVASFETAGTRKICLLDAVASSCIHNAKKDIEMPIKKNPCSEIHQ